MSGMTMAPVRATATSPTVVSVADRANAAIATANQQIQALIPSIGSNPLQRLMSSVADPKFVDIIKMANDESKKSSRTVGGVAILMDPTPASDASLPAELRPTVLKLRTLAAWFILAHYAPITLARATMKYLLVKKVWDPARYTAVFNSLVKSTGAAASAAVRATYERAVAAWRASQPWTSGGTVGSHALPGQAVTSGPQYTAWMALKPPAPPGVPALAGLSGGIFRGNLEGFGSSPRGIFHGFGEVGPTEGGGDYTIPEGTSYDPSAGNTAAGDAGTQQVNTEAQGSAGVTIPPIVWQLLGILMQVGAQGAITMMTQQPMPGGPAGGAQPVPPITPDGRDATGAQVLPIPPPGQEYDQYGQLRAAGASEGIPAWLIALGVLGVGYALTRS